MKGPFFIKISGSQARKKSSASREAGVSVYIMSEKSQNLTLESVIFKEVGKWEL